MGLPAPCIWHRDPTYVPCSEPRVEAAQRHPPSSPLPYAEGARFSHPLAPSSPRRVCNSQPRRGTGGDRRGEGCCWPTVQRDGQLRAAPATAISPATLSGE